MHADGGKPRRDTPVQARAVDIGPDPIRADGREEYARRQLPAGAACVQCGVSDPAVLGRRTILEAHHVAGRANDPHLVVILCLNCHRLQGDRHTSVGVALRDDTRRSVLEKVVGVLRGLAVFFEALSRSLIDWAHRVQHVIHAIDHALPGWLDEPEASS